MNLSFLLYLACPIGMGLMMWMMMRGNQGHQAQSSHPSTPPADLASLRQQLDSLEAQQQAIQAQMQRLLDEDAAQRQAEPRTRAARLEEAGSKQVD